MEIYLIIISVVFLAALGLVFWFFNRQSLMLHNEVRNLSQTVEGRFTSFSQTVDGKLNESARRLHDQYSENLKVIRKVTEKVTELQETNKQVMDFSQQLKNFEKILLSQKNRGSLGEAGLEMVLENILPPTSFSLQYKFKDGEVVDAAVFTKDGLIPVDAKFSLDNYNRLVAEEDSEKRQILEKQFQNDLKKRIDETAKYIKPKEGTLEFAFMFIPAEAIYYDLLVNQVGQIKSNTRSLIEYAFREKRVIIVSPTTFAAYLQTVLQGLRAFQIEEQAKEIHQRVENLQRHLNSYDDYLGKLGGNLATTVNSYNGAYREFKKIDKDIVKITNQKSKIEPLEIERPKIDS